jgi:Fic/DOC family protein
VVHQVPPGLWKRVNDHFRHSGQLYLDAPRPRPYVRKQRAMYRHFPADTDVYTQAAYLVKNLVNLQRFPDANKRTASVLLEVFLEANGYELTCGDDDYAQFLLQVQRTVPTERWDGRTFTLQPAYIPWVDDAYHRDLRGWLLQNTVRKP